MSANRKGNIRRNLVRMLLHPAQRRAGPVAQAADRAGNCGCSEREAFAGREAQRKRLDALEKLLGPV